MGTTCTLKNEAIREKCQVCYAQKPNPKPVLYWTCGTCTFEQNKPEDNQCSVCTAKKISKGSQRAIVGINEPPTYKPVRDFIKDVKPEKKCYDYVLEDCAKCLKQVRNLEKIVEQVNTIVTSKVDHKLCD